MIAALALAWTMAAPPAPVTLSLQSRSLQPGELVVLSIALAEAADHIRVRAFEREIGAYRLGERDWQALIGIDLDAKPGRYEVTVDGGSGERLAHADLPFTVAARTFRTRRLTVKQAFVTPPASERERIESDAQLLAAAWASGATDRRWTSTFVRPVPEVANSAFGTRTVFNGEPRNPHAGADFLSAAGTPVHAPNGGRVMIARDLYFSGNTVVIDHGLGLFSLLAHLSTIAVHEGDDVLANEIVGEVGATGRVTGPHLHWAVRAGGARVDPLSLLTVLGAPEASRR